jgi:solute carrier family 25 protein 42
MAGSVAKSVIAPAERVKMSFQISRESFSLANALARGKLMVRNEGVRSLWNGHSTTLVRVAPYAGLQFAVHDHMEALFMDTLHLDVPKLPATYKFAAGAIAGTVATLLTYPLDVLRVRLALTPGATWRSTIAQGGLMHGLAPTMAGIIPYSGTAWLAKQELHGHYSEVHGGSLPSFHEAVVLNGLAGLCGQFVTYPLDVLRRRMQMAGRDTSLKGLFLDLYRIEGTRGLLKGFTMNVFKGPITISVSMTTYDTAMRWVQEYED